MSCKYRIVFNDLQFWISLIHDRLDGWFLVCTIGAQELFYLLSGFDFRDVYFGIYMFGPLSLPNRNVHAIRYWKFDWIWIYQVMMHTKRGWRVRELIPNIGLIPRVISLKLFLEHSRFRKSHEGLETANPLMQISLKWTAQVPLPRTLG